MSSDRGMACFYKISPRGVLPRKFGPWLILGFPWVFDPFLQRSQALKAPLSGLKTPYKELLKKLCPWGQCRVVLQRDPSACRALNADRRVIMTKGGGGHPPPGVVKWKLGWRNSFGTVRHPHQSCIVDLQAEGTLAIRSKLPLRRSVVMRLLG